MSQRLLVHQRYEAGALLGRGAQGFVLRVIDREAKERQLVAKVWRAGHFDESALAAEFSLLRRLDIAGLVRAHDLSRDEQSSAPFLVEDFVDGVTARDFVTSDGAARQARLLTVLTEIAATLSGMHDAAFVHGDLKPEHVRVTADGRVFVLDLGSAITAERAEQQPSGFTPAFAAPELHAGARPSRASDLFSLGALCTYLVTGAPPKAGKSKLRQLAAWVPPSVADVIDALLELHPADRPESADEVLRRLGLTHLSAARRSAPAPIGRERELELLALPRVGVRYLLGPSGSGKSHLLREVATRALLAGRAVRRVSFPSDDPALLARLVACFRGTDLAWPFEARGTKDAPLLLALDDFHAAPAELTAALDAYRCRGQSSLWLDVIAAARVAPPSADTTELKPLDEAAFARLCAALGATDRARIAELAQVSGRQPGWVVAAHGRVPLTRDMVLERAKSLSSAAVELFGAMALVGGAMPEGLLQRVSEPEGRGTPRELLELLGAGLVARRVHGAGVGYALQAPELSGEIAAALGSFELAERIGQILLADESASARPLLTLAGCAFPPSSREHLLRRAIESSARGGSASDEIEGLFALCASPAERTREHLLRLERLTRHAGSVHPQVLSWLADAAGEDRTLVPLLRRREAEQAARAGNMALAQELAQAAEVAAAELSEPQVLALSIATRGAMALYRAEVDEADRALCDAAARLAPFDGVDPEELARLDHNLGVVSLYRDRIDDALAAFERSLELKRKLGDRAGVRSCLLNLGLALGRRGRFDAAESVLDEAIALARSLGQQAGRAWCLAARADLEVRRGNAEVAERYVAEGLAIAEAPPHITADLCIVRAQAALLEGDGARALAGLESLDRATRQNDALLDAKATLVEAGALLAKLPTEPRRAARLCIGVLRTARTAKLLEIEGQARTLLRAARARAAAPPETRYPATMDVDAELWALLGEVGAATGPDDAPLALLRAARKLSGAERALLALAQDGSVKAAWGVDLDGFALPEAVQRCDAELVRRACETRAPLYHRDIKTAAGQGARLAIPAPELASGRSAVLLLEQRFRPGAFDGLAETLVVRLGILTGIAARLAAFERDDGVISTTNASAHRQPAPLTLGPGQTTALPLSRARRSFTGIVGSSRVLEMALAKLDSAIDSELPVLISGETGTGKELFAKALHEQGSRAAAPLVALNCAAVPDSLFEAELFGHARGAFTGADRARPGLIARAEGGTLFLDEIGELPLPRQASLLRLLESRRYRAVGSDEERPFDVRIVCATNRDLELDVERGSFRQDLLFRINVVEIRVPALRERKEDIPGLVRAFLERSGARLSLAADAMSALEAHSWPGNVRELEHQIQRLSMLGVARVERAHLPRNLRRAESRLALPAPLPSEPVDERTEVQRALSLSRGNITHAARALGLTRHGLKKRMLRLGLRVRAEGGDAT
jgi:serine/threonine-protein kinase PknK